MATIVRRDAVLQKTMDRASTATVTPARRWIRPGRVRLPVGDPGVPDTRSPARLLVWVGRHQLGTLAGYESAGSGEVQSLSALLPWWSFKGPKR